MAFKSSPRKGVSVLEMQRPFGYMRYRSLTFRVKRGRGSQSKKYVAERGSNENLHGLVKQNIPKNACFMTIINK